MWRLSRISLAAPAVLTLLLLLLEPAAAGFHSRKIIIAEPTDAAVELDHLSFNRTLALQPTPYAIVEFFANWCPACRNYKPEYERVAKLFNGFKAPYPGFLYMAKVDCAIETNRVLCERYDVTGYPTLMWGAPNALAQGSSKSPDLLKIDDIRNLVRWINKKTNREFVLNVPPSELQKSSQQTSSQMPRPVYLHDIEEATAQAAEQVFDSVLSSKTHQSREALIDFLQLLVLHHPSKRCRIGSADILASFEDLWPPGRTLGTGESIQDQTRGNFSALRAIHICGDAFPSRNWKTCKGSKPETRGYTCGLWLLFHSLGARVDDLESAAALKVIHDFVLYFFGCDDCRAHFLKLSKTMGTVSSQKELVLWLWRAHNKVNERLMKEEPKSGSGDPEFPKVIWPPKYFCESCYTAEQKQDIENLEPSWNETAVVSYLSVVYGQYIIPDDAKRDRRNQSLSGDSEESASSSVAIGAAIAVALAICGFGVAACFWRMQQKRRNLFLLAGYAVGDWLSIY